MLTDLGVGLRIRFGDGFVIRSGGRFRFGFRFRLGVSLRIGLGFGLGLGLGGSLGRRAMVAGSLVLLGSQQGGRQRNTGNDDAAANIYCNRITWFLLRSNLEHEPQKYFHMETQ